jgi:hypothetical protein
LTNTNKLVKTMEKVVANTTPVSTTNVAVRQWLHGSKAAPGGWDNFMLTVTEGEWDIIGGTVSMLMTGASGSNLVCGVFDIDKYNPAAGSIPAELRTASWAYFSPTVASASGFVIASFGDSETIAITAGQTYHVWMPFPKAPLTPQSAFIVLNGMGDTGSIVANILVERRR